MIVFTMPIQSREKRAEFTWTPLAEDSAQAKSNHGGQTLQRLAERGGTSWCELAAILGHRRWSAMPELDARLACEAEIAGRRAA